MLELIFYICCGLVVALAGYTLAPLVSRRAAYAASDEREDLATIDLIERKDVIYRNIRDLEFDLAMGRISEEDYQDLRNRLTIEAAGVISRLDGTGEDPETEREVERRVKERFAKRTVSPAPVASSARTGYPCSRCGTVHASPFNFCPQCGAPAHG